MADPMSWAGIASMASGIVSAVGNYQAQKYKAYQSEQAAKIGKIQGQQIDTAYRDELSSTISNIRNIRASTGAGENSPTTLALEDANRKQSDANRSRDVANRNIQANQDMADSKFMKRSAGLSLGVGIGGSVMKLWE